jgi:hypothetical protein
MIVFRQVNEGYSIAGWHWNVEFFCEVQGKTRSTFPVGTAYVVASPDGDLAQLNFILVADHWRQQGVATSIVKACQERWTTTFNPQPAT